MSPTTALCNKSPEVPDLSQSKGPSSVYAHPYKNRPKLNAVIQELSSHGRAVLDTKGETNKAHESQTEKRTRTPIYSCPEKATTDSSRQVSVYRSKNELGSTKQLTGIVRVDETDTNKLGTDLLRDAAMEIKSIFDGKADTPVDRIDADSSKQEKSNTPDSHIHGSSSHGLYAISDFLRATDSFRQERMEMIASRSQSNSTQSAIVSDNKAGEKIRRSSFSNRPRAQSARQVRRKSHTRAILSYKEGSRKDKTVPPSVYKESSTPNRWGERFDRSQGQRTERHRSNSEEISDMIKSFTLDGAFGESSS